MWEMQRHEMASICGEKDVFKWRNHETHGVENGERGLEMTKR
jgi:hypothetical protein